MSAEPPVGHPCHQLSNPSAHMFWCRHCMTGFPDPMQRWRHSKECKAISSQKKYGGLNQPNQHVQPLFPKCDSPTPPQSDTSTPNKKKKAVDLKCYICKKEFITINEMRDHVKRPCNKPEVKNPLKDTFESLILTNEEDSDDSSSQNEDKVTNQIETLLKAAQILQQKKDQLMADSKQIDFLSSVEANRMAESTDLGDSPFEHSQSAEVMFDLVLKRSSENKEDSEKQLIKSSAIEKKQQAYDSEKLGDALKIYDFVSDTPESSPHRVVEPSPCHLEPSPTRPDLSPSQPEMENNKDEEVSNEAFNKTYVSSLQPQTSDSNKIPKITLKLVSGEKPKAEVWGIGIDLPKRVRKRKSKDFFDEVATKNKVKKKEMTLKEMQDKLVKNREKQKGDKKKTVDLKEKESETESPEGEKGKTSENLTNDEKEPVKEKVKLKIKRKEVRTVTRTRSGKTVGKKNLVVVLTDCLSKTESSGNSRRQSKAAKSANKTVNNKQKSVTKTKAQEKAKSNGKAGSVVKAKNKKENSNSGKQPLKNDKSKVASNSNTAKGKVAVKQKPITKPKGNDQKNKQKNEKPVKCKACDRVFRTRDLLIKHNQIPCRARNTRNMTQIILRPKKQLSHTLPLTQRQINAAKRRKQVAGKLSMLDNSVKKEDVPASQSEKTGKSKKVRNRKRLASPYFTFCITPKDKSQIFEPLDFDSLSEKDQYFYKLGMYSVALRKKTQVESETIELDKEIFNVDLTPKEITIVVDTTVEEQSVPSLTSIGSEISPPILEKVSEISVELEGQNEKENPMSKLSSSQISPPDLILVHGAQTSLTNAKLQQTKVPNVSSSSSRSASETPTSDSNVFQLTNYSSAETVDFTTSENGAHTNTEKLSNKSEIVPVANLGDYEFDKENRGDNLYVSVSKKKEAGVGCNAEEILNEVEKYKHSENAGFGVKLIKPRIKSFIHTSVEKDISSQTKSTHVLKNGTNRKLTYTVTLGIQTEQSFIKTKTMWLNKSLEMENANNKEKLKNKEKENSKGIKDKMKENVPEKVEQCNEKLKEKGEERNLFHSIEDILGVPKEKKDIVSQDLFMESFLPGVKDPIDDILEMATTEPKHSVFQNTQKINEKNKYTEVEITLPNKSKIAQLYTDIDWLALSDSEDAAPMKLVSPKMPREESGGKISGLSSALDDLHQQAKIINHDVKEVPSLNSVISNYTEKFVEDVCNIPISKPQNEVQAYNTLKHGNEKPKVEEVYIYPKKPLLTRENVSVTAAKPSRVDTEMNHQSSNNLLDLIAKTMGTIPESAKQKFEKSVLSLLNNATSPKDSKNVPKDDTQLIIMNTSEGVNEFTSDITVIDDGRSKVIPQRVGNDHVIRPSNFCNVSSTVSSFGTIINASSLSQRPTYSNSNTGPEDLSCTSVNQLNNRHDFHSAFRVSTAEEQKVSVSENSRCINTIQHSQQFNTSNFDNQHNCIAERRKSPRPANITINDTNHLDVFKNGNKDGTVNALSDQESPTIITNFDFEKYAEHLKEETFFTAQPLSPIRPVSLTPSCSRADNINSESHEKISCLNQGSSKTMKPVDTFTSRNETNKTDLFLKPLAIDCSQSKEEESYICDISPPLEGPTHISPVDLAKVARGKMTNELILKSQGFGQGLLQMSGQRPMLSPNIAFLPQNSAQMFVAPKTLGQLGPQKLPQEIPVISRTQEQFGSPTIQSPFDGNIGNVQFIDVHLNTYSQNSVLSPKLNMLESQTTAVNTSYWDKRQNIIVSPPFNQNRSKPISSSIDEHAQTACNQERPKQANDNKQKRHSVNILRNNNKKRSEPQDLTTKTSHSTYTNHISAQVSSTGQSMFTKQQSPLMSQAFNSHEKHLSVTNSPKSYKFPACEMNTQDSILDMVDKTSKGTGQFIPNIGSNKIDQYQPKHPKFSAHQRHNQLQNSEKTMRNSPKTVVNDRFSEFQQQPSASFVNSRLTNEPTNRKTKNRSDKRDSVNRNSRVHKMPVNTNVGVERFQHLNQQDALFMNSGISSDQNQQRSNLSNMQRSHSYDHPKTDFRQTAVDKGSVIRSPVINPTQNFRSASKGNIFEYQNSVKSFEQNQSCGINSNFQGHINDSERVISHVQRQQSAPSLMGNKPQASLNIVPSSDYENVSSPEEVEVYPTTPRTKKIPQNTLPPYRLEHETLSLHSDKRNGPQISIPQNFNFKSSLEPRVQYREQTRLGNPLHRTFSSQQSQQSFYQSLSRPEQKPGEIFEPSMQFSEFCQGADISDSILDNI